MENKKNIILVLLIIFISSCNGEFSNYTKYGKTDWEKDHLKGEVKEVKRFWNGEITDISRYNKYGFITEEEEYEGGQLKKYKKIKYNEYGKIVEIENKDENRLFIVSYEYDANNNVIEIIEDTKEVYNTEKDIKRGKVLLSTHEYTYDKVGGIINEKIYNRLGTCVLETIYNADGKVVKIKDFDENGKLDNYTDFSYRGKSYESKQTCIGGSDYLDMYITDTYYDGFIIKRVRSYEDGNWAEIIDYKYLDGEIIEEISKWVADTDDNCIFLYGTPRYKKGDICTTVTTYTTAGNKYIIERTTYYPGENIDVHKDVDERQVDIYKYDKIGNIVYSNDENEENQEYTYEYTYY